jgi:hypothetical protein
MTWWLCIFVLASMIPIGSLALLLAYGITGGRWGRDLMPALVPAARTIPLLIVGFVPIIVLRPALYHWDTLTIPDDVRHLYLNPFFFDIRTLFAIVVWSLLAWMRAWENELYSALGLIAHLVLLTFIPADWVLTLPPGTVSAGFGFGTGIEQMFAALAFAAVCAPQSDDQRASGDLSGLLIATLLGTVYFVYMQFAITWYGNVPEKVHWYAMRAEAGWSGVALAAFLIGAALPFIAMLSKRVRTAKPLLRLVGAMVLFGVLLHVAYLVLPAAGVVHAS